MILPYRLIKFGFFLLYNHLAFTYDLVAWFVSIGRWAGWRRAALEFLVPGPTLELACGTGGLFFDMYQDGLSPVGLDLSPYMLRLTKGRWSKTDKTGQPCCLIQAKAQELPFPDRSFKNVVATFPTNYIFEPETLIDVHRILITDFDNPGRLIIVLQGQLQTLKLVAGFIDWLYDITGQRDFFGFDPLAPFQEAGFEAQWTKVTLPDSTVSLILAKKINLK